MHDAGKAGRPGYYDAREFPVAANANRHSIRRRGIELAGRTWLVLHYSSCRTKSAFTIDSSPISCPLAATIEPLIPIPIRRLAMEK